MINEVDFYEWRANKYGLEYKARDIFDELSELDELLPNRHTTSSHAGLHIGPRNPDAEQEELDRLQTEREELDQLLAEQEERDLQSKLEEYEELDRELAELLTPATGLSKELGGGFPQDRRQALQRRFSANDKSDPPKNSAEKAITRKTARLTAAPISGDFPQKSPGKPSSKRRCTPRLAGVLATLYQAHESTLAVLGELLSKEPCTDIKIRDEIKRMAAALEFQKSLARSAARGVSLPDWERRLPPETKRAFALLALARHPAAKSFTFRLGHEVAEAAMSAKHGPTDYLARILQRLGLTQTAFVIERSNSESHENNPYHIHGVAIIPAELLEELTRELIGADGKPRPGKLQAALAPPPCKEATPPVRGYRQRYNNKAIDIQPVRTAGGWFQYIIKEIDFTAHRLSARPDYASRSAIRAGKALYESIQGWIMRNRSAEALCSPPSR